MNGIGLDRGTLGSAPKAFGAGFGSLPKRTLGREQCRHVIFERTQNVVGKLPTTTGWQPVLPNPIAL
jgi:hypothetical protein